MTVPDMHTDRSLTVQAQLEDPVWGRRPPLLARAPLLLAAFLVGDPPAGPLEVRGLDTRKEAQHLQTGRRTIVHVFESTSARKGPATWGVIPRDGPFCRDRRYGLAPLDGTPTLRADAVLRKTLPGELP